ncbi:Nose resistant to fluoxetine protein 6 [Orchesella cincta]|uniref:Nose resistant to fluoxetine protein 6 n=1 Tax=Orchesella cincta TaxID=48709 RepID=A0A1D2MXR6_ORCCI|nr:Nose resistant to fluoxetine protein 6 [Orchesella cincta]
MKGAITRRLTTLSLCFAVLSLVNGAAIPEDLNGVHSESEFGEIINSGLLAGVDPEVSNQLVRNMIFPSYIQDFLKLFETKQDLNPIIAKLFDGVYNESCKGHSMEWIRRVIDTDQNVANELNKWVLQMVDSWGKPPEGMLSGHVNAYGDFDECVNIKVSDLEILNNVFKTPPSFEGRYCSIYFADYNTSMRSALKPIKTPINGYMTNHGINESIQEYMRDIGVNGAVSFEELMRLLTLRVGVLISPSMGVCMPNSCSMLEIQQILINAFDMMYTEIKDSKLYPEGLLWPWPTPLVGCLDKAKPDLDAADISVMTLLSVIGGLCLVSGITDYWLNHGVDKPPKRGLGYQYFMSFSLYTNIKKWLSTRRSAEDMGCLHGIRFLSTSWVVLAHTYYVITFLPQWNMVNVKQVYENWPVMTVINSTFAVDTFFVLSGMLVCYNLFKMFDKTKGKINVPMFYVHRYLRLTPTYAILVGIMATIVPYLGKWPYWGDVSEADGGNGFFHRTFIIRHMLPGFPTFLGGEFGSGGKFLGTGTRGKENQYAKFGWLIETGANCQISVMTLQSCTHKPQNPEHRGGRSVNFGGGPKFFFAVYERAYWVGIINSFFFSLEVGLMATGNDFVLLVCIFWIHYHLQE